MNKGSGAVVSPQTMNQAYSRSESESIWVIFVCSQVRDGENIILHTSWKAVGTRLRNCFLILDEYPYYCVSGHTARRESERGYSKTKECPTIKFLIICLIVAEPL